MKGRKIKSERIAKTCGAALAVSLMVTNVNCAVCEGGAAVPAGGGIQNTLNTNQAALLTPTPSVTPLLKKKPAATPTPAATEAPALTPAPEPTEAPVVTEAPALTPMPEPTEEPVVTEAPALTPMPEPTEAPVLTPAPEQTVIPESDSTQKPEEGTMPEESDAPAPGDSVLPEESDAPVPEDSVTPDTNVTPGTDSADPREEPVSPETETPKPDAEDASRSGSVSPAGDTQSEDDGVSGMPETDGADETEVPDVSFAGSEELVGFTTFAAAKYAADEPAAASYINIDKMIAGSSPLVGGEIAEGVYGDDSSAPADSGTTPAASSTPAETPISDWSSEMTESLSSGEEETEPVFGEPDDAGGYSSTDQEESVSAGRFGVLTGDTTDILSYVMMGLSSVAVAFLTFVTMCARGRKRPEKGRPED